MTDSFQSGLIGLVIRNYRPANPSLLVFDAGEELMVGRNDDHWPEYVLCTNGSGVSGWAPENFIRREGKVGIGLRHYSAYELVITTGERLILHEEAGGWFWATNEAGENGWAAAENLEIQTNQDEND